MHNKKGTSGTRVFPSPLMIAAIYAALGFSYIIASDILAANWISSLHDLTAVQIAKGSAFVLITSVILYRLTSRCVNNLLRATSAQRESDARYQQLIETTHEGVWVVDEQGTTQYVNTSMARMLGYEPQEMLGKHCSEFMDETWHARAEEKLAQRRTGSYEHYEFQFRRRDGSPIWVIVCSSPIMNAQGQFSGMLKMVTDITDRKQMEEALGKSVELERTLFNELDHRVRNNLMAVLSIVLLTRETESDVRQFAATIGSRVQALAHAQGMLPEAMRGRLTLARLVERLIPADVKHRVRIRGTEVAVGVAQTGAISILISELISLSRSCGSLSRGDGDLRIEWSVIEQTSDSVTVHLRWLESEGLDAVCARLNATCRPILEGLLRSDLRGGFLKGAELGISMKLDRNSALTATAGPVKNL